MKRLLFISLAVLTFQNIHSQVAKDSELYLEFKRIDSFLFDNSFNKCKLEMIDSIISNDLEFYHDKGGLDFGKESFMTAMKNNICANWDKKPIRKLVDDSMEIYPLYENNVLYGVIQNGIHEFYIKEPKKELYKTGIAKFTSVWLNENDTWVLKRVLSFDHKPVN
ncbi:nuclear transport factor 2 family protein [Urechidicola croceus]|uniref:Uncharacterized protein n=1 Tax=Urechidicola croceus TaxID=1850246 RepID=A0A1D8PB91_9FLAO|nr:DUF4440 domain-containing protein [Urechidicola croceus]AOW21834.1 hypothetical protein LPB138_14585 [Urechidicola croceus]